MKLYWLESADHSEDWFVISSSAKSALRFFCLENGYEAIDDDVRATSVCDVPDGMSCGHTQFADDDEVRACGGVVRSINNPELLRHYSAEALECLGSDSRVVTIGGKTFIEGTIANAVVDNLVSPEHYN